PIHGRDLAKICIRGMIAKEKEIEVGGSEIFTLDELARLMFKVQSKSAKVRHVPTPLAGLVRQGLRLIGRSQLDAFDFLASGALRTGLAPAQGEQKLEAYLKAYLESPFYRE
ncbi:MAG: hypothetical protein CVV27_14975, partial [Candidatus Melainabacteria bacterium HGW-Melainabacteria-1]